MKILVAVIVYNRYDNLKRWLKCWKECNQENAELIIIHTGDERPKYLSLCVENKVCYVHRQNQGFDIGCMQDVFRERLNTFPNDWDYILWCTDDTFPMSKDFIAPFIEKIQAPGVGISCMQLSPSVSPHVRTTGFCIKKETSRKIVFPVDPVRTKQDCYFFEHRGGAKTFTNQVRAMGLSCVAVAPNKNSPLWDSGYWKRLDRQAEHDQVFSSVKKSGDKVLFIVPIYHNYPQIISSLICQTIQDWELMLIHDGPGPDSLKSLIASFSDERIQYSEYPEHTGFWGHKIRQWALNEIRDRQDINYLVISNPDNYYVPQFLNYMLHGIKTKHTAVAAYCSHIVHSYIAHAVMTCRVERGFIDCGSVLIKKNVACEIGWRDVSSHSADWVFFSDIASQYSTSNFVKVPGALFTHN